MILDSFKLDGKVAIITGAGRGLGRAMAVKFAETGADIVAAARTQSQLDETAEAVKKTGRKCLIVPTDVTISAQVNALAEATIKEFGKIDTNLSSQFYGCRAVAPQMVKQKRGKIINIASGYGLRGGKHNFMYACAKGGTIQLTRSMALSYAQFNIQTNCIVPGVFPHNEEMMQFFKGGKFIPIGRVGEDSELGPLAVFLASDASNHVNGELIAIDGGGLAGGIAPTGVSPETSN
jgi:2-deoxy-D-gluconate 3-dehydrogenase